jgi:diacylglycerol kinase family enzyme
MATDGSISEFGGGPDTPSSGRRVDVIINSRSGVPDKGAVAERVQAYLSSGGMHARMELARAPEDLAAAASRAAAGDADIVVAGGGDGTIATVAAGLLDSSKLLGVLPLGTFNYFARRVGVPLDVTAALGVITTGSPVQTSVGEVNGRLFLNNASIGLYPELLKRRETTYGWIGRSQAAAYLSVALVLVQPPNIMDLQLAADTTRLSRRTPLLFVGINPSQLETFGIPGHECLARDGLALYITKPLSAPQLWKLALRGFFRGLHGAGELEVVCARELHVTLRRRRVRVAMDGEIVKLPSPLRFRIRSNALRLLVPSSAARTDVPS